MNLDELRSAWQSKENGLSFTIDESALLKAVGKNQRRFNRSIFWRDVREVGACILVAIVFIFYGMNSKATWGEHLWTWYIASAVMLGVGGFMVIDRMQQERKARGFGDSVVSNIECSLMQVNHQIWLLRNVLWWYLLPPGLGIMFVFIQYFWQVPTVVPNTQGRWIVISTFAGVLLFCYAFFYGVYKLNQWGVRKDLLPRREELEVIYESLKEGGDSSERDNSTLSTV